MDLTGHATDFVVDSAFPEAMKRFVRSAQQRWPGLYMCGERLEPGAVADWQLPEPSGDYSEIVTFSAGQEMEDFWQENGYALDSTGQGPYSVFLRFARPAAQGILRIRRTGGLPRRGDSGRGCRARAVAVLHGQPGDS